MHRLSLHCGMQQDFGAAKWKLKSREGRRKKILKDAAGGYSRNKLRANIVSTLYATGVVPTHSQVILGRHETNNGSIANLLTRLYVCGTFTIM